MFWLCALGVALIALLQMCGLYHFLPEAPALSEGERVALTGCVIEKEENLFCLEVKQVLRNDSSQESGQSAPRGKIPFLKSKIKVYCAYPQENAKEKICLGRSVAVSGVWKPYLPAGNPGEFDAKAYYASIGVVARLVDTQLLSADGRTAYLREALQRLRGHFSDRMNRVFPQTQAGILNKMLLGEKASLDKEIKELYQRNGIIHILAISGLHITLIGMGLYRLLRKVYVPVPAAAVAGGVFMVLYGLMTGFPISARRAIGMYLLKMLSYLCGRTYDLLTALGVMALLMVCAHPAYLQHAGFLLSYTSLLGIGAVYPVLRRKETEGVGKNRIVLSAVDAVISSVSISLVTIPVQLWFYYEVPVWSAFLNVLILPCMSVLVICALVVMLVPGSGLLGTVCCVILRLFEMLCRAFEKLPFHTWNPGRPALWQIGCYYALLAGGLWYLARREQKQKKETQKKEKQEKKSGERIVRYGKWAIALALIMTLGLRGKRPAGVTFLDVGQGDSILVQTAAGETFLFDCGSLSRKNVGEYVLIPFLKYYGIHRLDGVFVSHADQDHMNGVQDLLQLAPEEHIAIGQVILPGETASWDCAKLIESLPAGTRSGAIRAGDGWESSSCRFLCLNPPEEAADWENNEMSQAFWVTFMEQGKACLYVLLAGDTEGKGEQNILEELAKTGREQGVPVVLKVAHHGSRFTTSQAFLQLTEPQLAVISAGRNNRYGHPHAELLERLQEAGAQILRTDQNGAVTVETCRGRVQVRVFGKE